MSPLHNDPPTVESLFGNSQLRSIKLEELDKIIESSSEKNRNFFIAYLSLLIYVQFIVFSTSDLQLFTGGDIKLPFAPLNIPIGGFYWVAPIFIIILHFNFLQNLEIHHYKLIQWKRIHPNKSIPRWRIEPFLFDHAALDAESPFRRLVRYSSDILCLNLAPLTLGLLLWRYTDIQDISASLWQLFILLLDCWLVFKLRLSLVKNGHTYPPSQRQAWVARAFSLLFFLIVLLEIAFTGIVSLLPTKDFLDFFQKYPIVDKLDVYPQLSNLFVPRIAVTFNQSVWKADEKALEMEANLAGEQNWTRHFKAHGHGFTPFTLNLRFAQLRNLTLPKAQLEGAKLEKADLSFSNLEGAYLDKANFQGANLKEANLNGAFMIDASFYKISAQNTKIQNAHLNNADFRGADLTSVNFQGSEMIQTKFQAAKLKSVQLQGVDLRSAKFHGADMDDNTAFEGANLQGIEFQGAYFGSVNLQGSNLSFASFQGAELGSLVNLQGAILQNTMLFGTTPPRQSNVYALEFATQIQNWDDILKFSDNFPEGLRWDFTDRIGIAKQTNNNLDVMRTHLLVNKNVIHAELIPLLCQSKADDEEIQRRETRQKQVWAIHGIRNNVPLDERHLIDQVLCKRPQCAEILKDIGNFDCKLYVNHIVKRAKS